MPTHGQMRPPHFAYSLFACCVKARKIGTEETWPSQRKESRGTRDFASFFMHSHISKKIVWNNDYYAKKNVFIELKRKRDAYNDVRCIIISRNRLYNGGSVCLLFAVPTKGAAPVWGTVECCSACRACQCSFYFVFVSVYRSTLKGSRQ